MLSSYRVLDLSDERGQLAGLMLSDLGADVILIEPPGGSPSRRVGPFVDSRDDDPEASLWFWSYNRGKRSLTLDLDTAAGKEQFMRLVATADVVIESSDLGEMAARGLGPEELIAQFPQLVYTSISAFGRSGPKAHWTATDLVVSSAGMLTRLMGDADRPPLRIPLDQTFLHASGEAALATLVALRERKRSGLGQHVDVSAQQVLPLATQSMAMCHLYNSPESTRVSGGAKIGPFDVHLRARVVDGYVSPTIVFGESIGPFGKRLFEWMHSLGACDSKELEIDWIDFVDGVMTGRIGRGEYERIQQVAADFFATCTKKELLAASLEHRLLVVPIADVSDVVNEEHYQERDFWCDIDMSAQGVRSARFPGPNAKFTKTPISTGTPPPKIGQHTAEVLDGLDAPSEASEAVSRTVAPQQPATGKPALPLDGVKILDFMWVIAGPACTRVLSDWGATVVRVESSHKVEAGRTLQPFLNDEGGADNGGIYQNMNAGKLGIAIDIDNPDSRELIEDLVRWADVVTESFSPKVMRDRGITYDTIRQIKPEIIMASSCLFGQTGPLSSLAGFGSMGAAMSGFYEMTGWPDRDPCGVFGAYTDYVSPKFLGCAILAALEHRDNTGEGQYIDLSQVEASLTFLAPALLDYTVNGRLPNKVGNDHPTMSPHGVFATAGDQRWLAIACEGDSQWRALCGVDGLGERLAALDGQVSEFDISTRRVRSEEIAAAISEWSQSQVGEDAQELLQDAGVAAHIVHDSKSLSQDPQMVHRNHFRHLAHSTNEKMWVEGPRFLMSRSTDELSSAGPSYGEHTFEVLENLLGYDADRVAALAVAGVLE